MVDIGDKIGPYRIERRLGEGGMGAVFEAFDEKLDKKVALKVLLSDCQENPLIASRFEAEARALAQLNELPGVVSVHCFATTEQGIGYLVMDLLEGQTLADWMQEREGRIPLDDAVTIARQIAGIVAAVHDKEVIHRDLKPANIILVRDEREPLGVRPIICDFGIAKLRKPSDIGENARTLPKTEAFVGTVGYAAPEQCLDYDNITKAVDVYAWGVILYELIAGKPLFQAKTKGELFTKHVRDVPERVDEVVPEVPRPLASFVARTLEKEPAARPSMRECAERLAGRWSDAPDVQGQTNAIAELEPRPRSTRRWRMAAGMMIVVLLMGGSCLGVRWWRREGSRRNELSELERTRGTLHAAEMHVDEAMRFIDEALARSPKDEELHYDRAMSLSKRGKIRLAQGDASRALADIDESIAELELVKLTDEDEWSTLATNHFERGQALLLGGDPSAANGAFKNAIGFRKQIAASTGAPYWKAMHAEALLFEAKTETNPSNAMAQLEQAQSLVQAALAAEHDWIYQLIHASIRSEIGRGQMRKEEWAVARESFGYARDRHEELRNDSPKHKDNALLLIDALAGLEEVAPEVNDLHLREISKSRRCEVAKAFVEQDPHDKRFLFDDCPR